MFKRNRLIEYQNEEASEYIRGFKSKRALRKGINSVRMLLLFLLSLVVFCFFLLAILNENDYTKVSVSAKFLSSRRSLKSASNPKIVLLPMFGLANRIRTLREFASFKVCAERFRKLPEMFVLWSATSDLKASYHELFSSPKLNLVSKDIFENKSYIFFTQNSKSVSPQILKEMTGLEARGHIKIVDFYYLNVRQMLRSKQTDYVILASGWGIRDVSCSDRFCRKPQVEFMHSLLPTPLVTSRVNHIISSLPEKKGGRRIGLHLRFTDMIEREDMRKITANLSYTIHVLRQKIDRNDTLFVATDTAESIEVMKKTFPNQVFFNENALIRTRNTLAGIQDAVVDLFALATCPIIWGNALESTFLRMATDIAVEKSIAFCVQDLKFNYTGNDKYK